MPRLPYKKAVNDYFRNSYKVGKNFMSAAGFYKPSMDKYNRMVSSRSRGSTGVVTNQYDVKTWYKKGRMNRRKRRSWKKFSNKVKAVLNKNIAPTIKLLRHTGQFTTGDNAQNWSAALLYTSDGTFAPDRDIQICKDSIVGLGNDFATKYRFESACLDLIMKNDTDTFVFPEPIGVDPQKIIVDLYQVECRKDVPNSVATGIYSLLFNTFTYANDDADATDVGKILLTQIGAAIFHNPLFCRYFKVVSKKAIQIGPGQSVELQIRDPKNKNLFGLSSEGISAKRGFTKGFIWSIRGVPYYDNATTNVITPRVHMTIGYTRSYVMRPLQSQTIATGFKIA